MNMLLILSLLASSAFASPIKSKISEKVEIMEENALENFGLYEGDILMDSQERFGKANSYYLWPKKTIPYEFRNISNKLKLKIKKAMNHISKETCFKFEPRTNEKHYVFIISGNGCNSYVGCKRRGPQKLSLGSGCHRFGTIVHELMHAIGFYHQHSRPDRDQYLDIHWENIKKKFQDEFSLFKKDKVVTFTPFDYGSIMMYGMYSFSKDKHSMTMSPKKPGIVIKSPRHKNSLSKYDVLSINKLYNCV